MNILQTPVLSIHTRLGGGGEVAGLESGGYRAASSKIYYFPVSGRWRGEGEGGRWVACSAVGTAAAAVSRGINTALDNTGTHWDSSTASSTATGPASSLPPGHGK